MKKLLTILIALVMCLGSAQIAAAQTTVPTESEAYKAITALKGKYPEGSHLKDDAYYEWNGGEFCSGYGGAAFVFELSDAAFGDLPSRRLTNINIADVHVGDILRMYDDTHCVIITEVHSDYVIAAEAGYANTISWKVKLTSTEVAESDYLMTRYPEGALAPKYALIFDANKGYGSPHSIAYSPGSTAKVPATTPSRAGNKILGWSTSVNGSVKYKPGDTFTINQTQTLYAVWQKVQIKDVSNIIGSYMTFRISRPYQRQAYAFTAPADDTYTFTSYGYLTTIMNLYDEDGNLIATGNPAGRNTNFQISEFLNGGDMYYLEFYSYRDCVGGMLITIGNSKVKGSIFDNKSTGLTLTNASDGIRLKWSLVPNASGYYIYRKSTGGYKLLCDTSSVELTTYIDSSVKSKNGTKYIYAVCPYFDDADRIIKGSKSEATCLRLKGVSIKSASNTATRKLTLKWNKNASASGYEVQRATNLKFTKGKKTVTVKGASKLSKTFKSLTRNKPYYVRVRAYKTLNGRKYYSSWSAKKKVTIKK